MNKENNVQKPWYKKWWAIALFIFIGLGILGSLGKDKGNVQTTTETGPQTAQNAPETGKTYQQVFTFTGNGAKKSEPFTINGNRLKIKYDCKGDMCMAFAYKVGSNLPTLIMNTQGSTKDETIIYGTGEYYIDANTLGSYTMIVEDYK